MNIVVRDARQHNLQGVNVRLPHHALTVVTGVSGSGKSSLAFSTLYAEGQRRYVESFSTYARQFLERIDRPKVERIDGLPPAVAIAQAGSIRTSRSTVATMTEVLAPLAVLWARAAELRCAGCARPVEREDAGSIWEAIAGAGHAGAVLLGYPVEPRPGESPGALRERLRAAGVVRLRSGQGVERLDALSADTLAAGTTVVLDRITPATAKRGRVLDSIEQALHWGEGTAEAWWPDANAQRRFAAGLRCADCETSYPAPTPALFSWNSPLGACTGCRGFGSTIDIDPEKVIPDHELTLRTGAVKPFSTPATEWERDELLAFCRRRKIPLDLPWRMISPLHRRWILDGDDSDKTAPFPGVRGFFKWLERKTYKMHVRVFLARFRQYVDCADCGGGRLRPEARQYTLAGLDLPAFMQQPVVDAVRILAEASVGAVAALARDQAAGRLSFLERVGLGYLTLDRQTRTLSGGEVQRVHLAAALGTELSDTLFVCDEPTVGLHARDVARLTAVLHELRDRGNTLVVVEHDTTVVRASDHVIDLGPDAGAGGGHLMFSGTPAKLARSRKSRMGRVLSSPPAKARDPKYARHFIEMKGVTRHNVVKLDVRIPMGVFTAVTGVSGSGKSTLIVDVLHKALTGETAACTSIDGRERLDGTVLVDQSPLARTSRGNPASYTKALDPLRKKFAATPMARRRGYGPGTFSFNVAGGRCERCTGEGIERIEMQFLADVDVVCADCKGTRFRPPILEVKVDGLSIADVLDCTVDQAAEQFGDDPAISERLEPLRVVGLGYLKLGQPLATLSGGEAQRVKLARHLGVGQSGRPWCFLLDEPTTGLHPDDVAILIDAFRRFVDRGHTVIVVEHHLDVIRHADHIIDMGPEGGAAGGTIVAQGTPDEVIAAQSCTGLALAGAYEVGPKPRAGRTPAVHRGPPMIRVQGAREHNLQNVSVAIPRGKVVVVTGPSGSGKSTLAFDIVFAEGQRRYLETLSPYARQFLPEMPKAAVEHLDGIPPTVAIEQRTSRGGRRSTVGTVTEIYHFLRLLYARVGEAHCPECGGTVKTASGEDIAATIKREAAGTVVTLFAPLVMQRKGFHRDVFDRCRRAGVKRMRVDGEMRLLREVGTLDRWKLHDIDAEVARIRTGTPNAKLELGEAVERALALGQGIVSAEGTRLGARTFSLSRSCLNCAIGLPEPDPRDFSFNSRQGACARCGGLGSITRYDLRTLSALKGLPRGARAALKAANAKMASEPELDDSDPSALIAELPAPIREAIAEARSETVCPDCDGTRLKRSALSVRVAKRNIADLSSLTAEAALETFDTLAFRGRDAVVAKEVLRELRSRTRLLVEVGLGYLQLDRQAPTLSGGEAQRVRLAAQLGADLHGACYVLDEPTIGLHPRDTQRLLKVLRRFKKGGNTVLVVEHDEATIRAADHVIDMGPGGGRTGGRVVAEGTPAAIIRNRDSATGRWLLGGDSPFVPAPEPRPEAPALEIRGATYNNLHHADARFPLGGLTCVTGVSGSGKSSLVEEVLHHGLRRILGGKARTGRRRRAEAAGTPVTLDRCDALLGHEAIDRVLLVDQTPIGKTPRSVPASYIGFLSALRSLYAQVPEARARGFNAGRFSFNTPEGRCPECEGQGRKRVGMSFLPDVWVGCLRCNGLRFDEATLSVRFKGHSIGELLLMSVAETLPLFEDHPQIVDALALLDRLGLGYLTLGQPSPTLSGGEAQRVKLASEMATRTRGHTCYILDEPTTGLHMADVAKLTEVLRALADRGDTVVVIEHNLDLIARADWVVDLGPESGTDGGHITGQGHPLAFAKQRRGSHTAKELAKWLKARHAP